jgi:hypothetical protein
MRIGFDGLYGKIRDVLECDPTSGHIFKCPFDCTHSQP